MSRYIEIYSDSASDAEVQQAIENFMITSNYFEASSWQIHKLPDGTFKETCCSKHPARYFATLKEWQENSSVYPDQEQWVDD